VSQVLFGQWLLAFDEFGNRTDLNQENIRYTRAGRHGIHALLKRVTGAGNQDPVILDMRFIRHLPVPALGLLREVREIAIRPAPHGESYLLVCCWSSGRGYSGCRRLSRRWLSLGWCLWCLG